MFFLHNLYVKILHFLNVFTCINNLIESEILYFRKACKTYNKTYDKYATFHHTRYRKSDIEISD